MFTETLFKRTSTGAVQTWCVEFEGNRYRAVSGQIDGKKVESGWQYAEGKNVGKSNETTDVEQRELEVAALVVKKLAQGGYHERIEDIDSPKFFKPMLAQDYAKFPVDWAKTRDVLSQPKLDGVRCVVTVDGMWSRQGKPIESCPHIREQLAPLFDEDPDLILDGELYADKLSDNFNEIISLVRKQKSGPEHWAKTAETIFYHIYDVPSAVNKAGDYVGEPSTMWTRLNLLGYLLEDFHPPRFNIVEVATTVVKSQDQLDELFAEYMAAGYEGQMIRLTDSLYENKRSRNLLKRKEFQDEEFKVVSIEEGAGNRGGMAGFINYVREDGTPFKSGIKGSHDYCRELLRDAARYEGGTGTVRFFGLTPDGKPRFPVTVALFEGDRDV